MKLYDEKQCLQVKQIDDIFQAMEITSEIAKHMGFMQNDRLFLKLVTEESCMNAYEYCQKSQQSEFKIYWTQNHDFLTILIQHKGEKFNIHFVNDEINYGLRGRGLQLIVNLMDHVHVEQNGEFIEFIMQKKVDTK